MITTYRNTSTGETAPAHCVGTDEKGDRIYSVPEGWEPVEPYWLDEDGLAHAEPLTAVTFAGRNPADVLGNLTDGNGDSFLPGVTVEQDYAAETTTITFPDGTRLVIDCDSVTAAA